MGSGLEKSMLKTVGSSVIERLFKFVANTTACKQYENRVMKNKGEACEPGTGTDRADAPLH